MSFSEGNSVIYLGISGFAVLILYDLASLVRLTNRFLISTVGYGIQIYAIILAALGDQMLPFPFWVKLLGSAVTLAGLSWLVYCLFLFRPIMRSYTDLPGPFLTTEGPYAFSRHPGFLGYVVFIAGLVMVSGSMLLMLCGVIWILFDLIIIIIQDIWVFRILFPGYKNYSAGTPMLFPNSKSFRRFIYSMDLSAKRGG